MDSPYLKFGIVCSLVLHLLAVNAARKRIEASELPPLDVDVIFEKSPERANPTQMVSPPSTLPESKTNQTALRLSDRDSTVQKETIKRGADPNAAPQKAAQPTKSMEPAAPSNPAPHQPAAKENAPKKLNLRLDSDSIKEMSREVQTQGPAIAESSPESYQAFSRAAGSGAQILGVPGSPDYLPDLPDGDLTLLNTKANQFAVFVQRVALRVFGELRASGWDTLSARDVQSVARFSTVRTTMTKKGELLKVEILSGSGSEAFDQVVFQAVKKGGADPNPPEGAAAADGLVHFVFQARSWVKAAVGKRGAPIQRRWLLLGTGLE